MIWAQPFTLIFAFAILLAVGVISVRDYNGLGRAIFLWIPRKRRGQGFGPCWRPPAYAA
jgi:hypothetical protein